MSNYLPIKKTLITWNMSKFNVSLTWKGPVFITSGSFSYTNNGFQ